MKKLKLSLIIFILFSYFHIFLLLNLVSAQAYRGLVVNEIMFDVGTVEPGSQVTRSFKVTHDYQDESEPYTIYLYAKDFTQGDTAGVPQFLEKDQVAESSRISDWITFEQDTLILNKRNDEAIITFTVTVPIDAEPGSKYAAILLSNQRGDQEVIDLQESNSQGFGLNSEVGPLLFLTVNGDITKELGVERIYTTNIKGKETDFFFNPPVNINIDFQNTGNVHVAPIGRVYIHKGTDYTKYYATYELNPDGKFVLPGTSRTFSFEWNDSFISSEPFVNPGTGESGFKTVYDWDKLSRLRFGEYNITLQYTYEKIDGSDASIPFLKESFLIVPWHLILAIGIIIGLILLFIFFKIVKRKVRNRKKNEQNNFYLKI